MGPCAFQLHQLAHVAPGEADLATAGLRLAGLRAGDTFIDVAAGSGGLSLPAARLGAKVLATDWSPKMIERAAVSPDDAARDHPVRIRAREFVAAGTRRWMVRPGIIFVGAEDNGVISAVS